MALNIIMAACMYPTLLIIYAVFRGYRNYENHRMFGVTVRKEWMQEDEAYLLGLQKKYLRYLNLFTLFAGIVPISCFFINRVSIQALIWCMWIFVALVLMVLPQLHTHRVLMKRKEEKGYALAVENQDILVELQKAGQIRTAKLLSFLCPFAVGVAVALCPIIDFFRREGKVDYPIEVLAIMYGTLLFCNVLFYIVAKWMDHGRIEVVSDDSTVNVNYARAKSQLWTSFWLANSWLATACLVVYVVVYWISDSFMNLYTWGIVVLGVLQMILVALTIHKKGKLDRIYRSKRKPELLTDDDQNWIGGLFYYNPRDKHNMVDARLGIGTTTNMARPVGKFLDGLGVIVIFACLFMNIWLIRSEFTPIALVVEDGTLQAMHMSTEYQLNIRQIENATLVTELPKMKKSAGTAMDELYKGTFYVPNLQRKCKVFFRPTNQYFIQFEVGGILYYMSGVDDAQTIQAFQAMQ